MLVMLAEPVPEFAMDTYPAVLLLVFCGTVHPEGILIVATEFAL